MKLTSPLSIYLTLARCKMYRFKGKRIDNKKTSSDLALQHFDFFYAPLFKQRWHSIRLALLCRQKLCAMFNNYAADQQKTVERLRELGAMDLKEMLEDADYPTTAPESGSTSPESENDRKRQKNADFAISRQIRRKAGTDPNTGGHSGSANDPLVSRDHSRPRDIDAANQKPPDNDVGSRSSSDSLHSFMPATRRIIRTDDDIEECEIEQQQAQLRPLNVKIVPDEEFAYPSALQVCLFPRGDVTEFPYSASDAGNVSGYYLLDASTIFAVVALNLSLNDYVLDMCCHPGGTSLTMLQTLLPGGLVCNDVRYTQRAKQVLNDFLPDAADMRDRITLKHKDPSKSDTDWDEIDKYDKVMVNVPCTADRQSLIDSDEPNLFMPGLNAQKLQLPDRQAAVLKAGLQALRPGGNLIYTTTSLSPIQNDNVVESALRHYQAERKGRLNIVIRDISPLAERFCRAGIFKFFPYCRYGELILPSLLSNFGPMYVCKFSKV